MIDSLAYISNLNIEMMADEGDGSITQAGLMTSFMCCILYGIELGFRLKDAEAKAS